MRCFVLVVAGALASFAMACTPGGYRPSSRSLPPGSSTICAFGIPGVRVSARDTDDGVDVSFAVVGDPTELRARVHEAFSGTGRVHLSPETQQIARRVHLRIDDEPSGLIVHAVPINPAEADDVRAAIHRRLEKATTSACD